MNIKLTNMLGRSRRVAQLYTNWPTALLDRSRLIPRRPLLYHLRNGVRFHVQARSFDVQVINEIWIDNIYTPSPRFSIRDGWTVADIGGQKGIFSVLAATSARGVKVYTFEPAPDSLATLHRNVALNALSNITIFGVAVSSKDGEARLHLAADSGCNSLIQRSDVPIRGDVRVETWSMERVLKTIPYPVNLLKMDIEGMEYETLFSCPVAYLQRVERIALEYHDDSIQTSNNTSELVNFLKSRGFSAHVWPERRMLFAERNNSV
jgi:FkbM family methyltransferase